MRIIVAGDSWACGEWGVTPRGYRVLHPGLQYYLRRAGRSVRVTAEGGGSNLTQLQRVRAVAHSADPVVFVQTDPMRDLTRIPGTLADYHRAYRSGLQSLYQGLAELPCRTLLVGGNAPVVQELIPPASPIQVVVADWVADLLGSRPLPVIGRQWSYPDCEPDLLSLWEREETAREALRDRAEHHTEGAEHQWFWPDGRHPNRLAHRWLADRLLESV